MKIDLLIFDPIELFKTWFIIFLKKIVIVLEYYPESTYINLLNLWPKIRLWAKLFLLTLYLSILVKFEFLFHYLY
jgi:hypothetical protein